MDDDPDGSRDDETIPASRTEADDEAIERYYDRLAPNWDEFVDGPWKADVLWPAVRSMLPDLDDIRALDAGCGNGAYAARLAEGGATVAAIDVSGGMVSEAGERYGDCASFSQADLTDALPFPDDEFDLVLSQHVFSHVVDLEPVFDEFARVCSPGGRLVASTHHPLHDYLVVRDTDYPDVDDLDGVDPDPVVVAEADEPTYDATERFEIHWTGPGSEDPGVYYRRPLSDLIGPLSAAGFDLRELAEPEPTASILPDDPADANALRRRPPRSICLAATRRR